MMNAKRWLLVNTFLVAILLGVVSPLLLAEETAVDEAIAEEAPPMKEYFVVLLSHGPNRDQPDSVAQEMQVRHLANIDRMWREGKAIIAGPFGDGNGGMIILTNTDLEETTRLVGRDPMVEAGRLVAEIRPWWAQAGILPESAGEAHGENH